MKIFDLQCTNGHVFEGWFSSEDDFQDQQDRDLLSCPLCGETGVSKVPSAPRLNLRRGRKRGAGAGKPGPEAAEPVASVSKQALQAAWLETVRRVMAHTEDVGERFTEEARRIHYGEAAERGIRGQATREQTRELLDEGIPVLPLPLPEGAKDTLQ